MAGEAKRIRIEVQKRAPLVLHIFKSMAEFLNSTIDEYQWTAICSKHHIHLGKTEEEVNQDIEKCNHEERQRDW